MGKKLLNKQTTQRNPRDRWGGGGRCRPSPLGAGRGGQWGGGGSLSPAPLFWLGLRPGRGPGRWVRREVGTQVRGEVRRLRPRGAPRPASGLANGRAGRARDLTRRHVHWLRPPMGGARERVAGAREGVLAEQGEGAGARRGQGAGEGRRGGGGGGVGGLAGLCVRPSTRPLYSESPPTRAPGPGRPEAGFGGSRKGMRGPPSTDEEPLPPYTPRAPKATWTDPHPVPPEIRGTPSSRRQPWSTCRLRAAPPESVSLCVKWGP